MGIIGRVSPIGVLANITLLRDHSVWSSHVHKTPLQMQACSLFTSQLFCITIFSCSLTLKESEKIPTNRGEGGLYKNLLMPTLPPKLPMSGVTFHYLKDFACVWWAGFVSQNKKTKVDFWNWKSWQPVSIVKCLITTSVSDEGFIEFLSAKKLLESNLTEFDQISKLLRSSLMKMSHTLQDNLLHYKISYMILGMAIILLVSSFKT